MQEAKTRKFSLRFNHEISSGGAEVRLWLPLVLQEPYQRLLGEYHARSNAQESAICGDHISTYYARFAPDKEARAGFGKYGEQGVVGEEDDYFELSFDIEISERNTDFSKVSFNENKRLSPEIEEFLKPSKLIPVEGAAKQKSDEITGSLKGDLEKARAIYEWVAKNMSRDNSVIACGSGDAATILSSGKLSGKCADINSVFVTLCRAAGIPARAIYGIRTGAAQKFSPEMGVMGALSGGALEISGAQHCRAEFYLKGYGWIPVDPADVTKVRLGEKLSNDDSKLAKIREYLFGNWEMCWIGFNYGRDFTLSPRPAQFPINNFGYPYGEVDGNTLNYYSPKDFSYDYRSKEL
ncbi:transglutaminase-like domain-containing protein [uncultured Campylobacter sp.]|uniref:transglutaminase-like domain-containing protein n=1 Tax=uncultured Campylobacter sp. TaxID=218934 RepID=UPI002616626B|nr:transglutaminase-like domain-containing protein [uncultured Campylobacter sp.]